MIFRVLRTEDLGEDTPSPSPSPSPSPPDDDFGVMSVPHCFDGPVAMPEYVAEWLRMTPVPWDLWSDWISTFNGANCSVQNYDQDGWVALSYSKVPARVMNILYWHAPSPDPLIFWPIPVTYAGSQGLPPSVPGTVIVEPPPPPPVMPPPPEPPILRECRQRIKKEIQQPVDESGYILDRLKSQATGQIDYQLAQVEPAIDKITNKINSNIINTMGEVYQGAYPIGLGIPSTEQIMMGEPVYSPYGIGADQNLPYCDYPTQTYTPTETPYTPPDSPYTPPPTTPPTPSPSPTPTPTPTPTYPPPTQPPGVSCPAPVVQCPDPPDIIFRPNIVVNIPKQDGTNVTVNVEPPSPTEPTTGGGYPVPPSPTEPEAPSPSPTPTEPEPEPTPTPTPTPPKPPIQPSFPDRTKYPPIQGIWGDVKACNLGGGVTGGSGQTLGQLFGYTAPGVQPKWIKAIESIDFIGPPIANVANELLVNTINAINQSTGYMSGDALAVGAGAILTQIIAGVVTRWVGFDMTYFTRSSVYDLNFLNPQTIPSETEFVGLYLNDLINADGFDCMIRANGSYPSWWRSIAQMNRTKATVADVIQLDRRGIIDPEEAKIRLRGLGVLNATDRDFLYKTSEAMPSVSDIVRFMVRDADDNTVADRYGTDAQLSTKYGAQLQSWAKGQGITDEVMKYYWRSHWEIPSNTALFEMLHRLRPNRTGQGLTGGITVNSTDIKDALVVNDVLPFWAERLMEISYKPLTRTDAQRAYFIDALSENELKDSYLDLGYNDDNADRLVRFTNQLKAKRKQTTGGTEKVPAVIKYYKNWLIGSTEATQRLRNSGLSETAAKEALQIASVQRKNDSQIKCIAGVKSQYKRYIINDIEARRDLTDIGVALENVGPLVNNWKCERASKPKELSAGQVCSAYQNNLINDVEYRRRMGAIGYQEDEAGILLEICRTKKGNLNDGSGDTTRIRTQQQKDDQTAAARAITAAAMSALNPPLEP